MTELDATIPDEAPLSLRSLSTEGERLLCDLLGFVQTNDGFTGEGAFDFYAYDQRYLGHYGLIDGIETINMTRHSEETYDNIFVRNLRNPDKPYLIRSSDYLTGACPKENTYGALRYGRNVINPPTQPTQEV
jgi:regulatory protein YycH of two-component signal transduction system YycFG